MNSSHSQPKLKVNGQVKPFQNRNKSSRRVQRRVLDKGIQYVHESFSGSHGKDVSILSWWKHLFARLTQPGSIQLYDGTSKPENHNLESSPENCTYDEDFNSTPSFMINNQWRNAVCAPIPSCWSTTLWCKNYWRWKFIYLFKRRTTKWPDMLLWFERW